MWRVLVPGLTIPYDGETRALLRASLEEAAQVAEGAPVPQSIREAERLLTEQHAEAVKALVAKVGPVSLVGFHGQTILHRPERRWTWQIGDGALLARLTGIDVINDFRSADVKAGGQGAPLVPLYHAALARNSPLAQPLAVVNIGGVANVTYIHGDYVLAFDTGPGNAPIDDWMHRHTTAPVDLNGDFARTGKVNDAALTAMLANPFLRPRATQITGPDGFRPERGGGVVTRGWCRDPDGFHGNFHRTRPRTFPAVACDLDHLWRRAS